MRRWHEDTAVMRRQRSVMEMCQKHLYGRSESPRVDDRFKPLGRYRKKHALDCGHAACRLCHGDKVFRANDTKAGHRLRLELCQ